MMNLFMFFDGGFNSLEINVSKTAIFSTISPGASVLSLNGEIRFIEHGDFNFDSADYQYRLIIRDRTLSTSVQVRLYYSNNLSTFVEYDINPVFQTGDSYCLPRNIMKDENGDYLLSYVGPQGSNGESVGIARCTDGTLINWTDLGYVIGDSGVTPSITERSFSSSLFKIGSLYYIITDESPDHLQEYYYLKLWKSNNLINWDIITEKFLDIGTGWESVAIYQANHIYSTFDKKYILYYTGQNSTDRQIGRAINDNYLTQYTKFGSNPLLNDNQLIGSPYVFYDTPNNEYRLFYKYLDGGTTWKAKEAILA